MKKVISDYEEYVTASINTKRYYSKQVHFDVTDARNLVVCFDLFSGH